MQRQRDEVEERGGVKVADGVLLGIDDEGRDRRREGKREGGKEG